MPSLVSVDSNREASEALADSGLLGVIAVTTITMPATEAPTAELLDVRAVAALLDCSPRHVYRMSDGGKMPPPIRLGALIRWRRQTGDPATGIVDWIRAGAPRVRKVGR